MQQYIGARYVTKIYENSQDPASAEWEANVNYEPLTMVTFNNGSYLSKKAVPASAGNPATATTYWVQTGFYNGQIASLQSQIDAINATLAAIPYNAKNFILVGDSWGTGEYADHGWAYYLENMLSDADQVYTACANGAGYSGYNGVQFIDQMQAIENSVTDPDAIQVVLVAGGLNDQTVAKATIKADIRSFVDYVENRYKNAIVVSVAINNEVGHTSTSTMTKDYINAWAEEEGYKNMYFFIDKTYSAPFSTFTNTNHLTNAGNEIIAKVLYGVLKGFDYKVPSAAYIGSTFTNNTLTGSDIDVTVSVRELEDALYVSIGSITINSFTPGGFLTSADFTTASTQIFPYCTLDRSHMALASAKVNGGDAVTFPVTFRMTGSNKITLDILNFNRGSSVTYTQLYIQDCSFVVPKEMY